MTMRGAFPALRARGGRGPQIGPGTFEGYTGEDETNQPGRFTAIVHAEGSGLPDTEYWCFLTDMVQDRYEYKPIKSGSCLWLDQIPAGGGFAIPSNPALLDEQLRQFASDKYLHRYGVLTGPQRWQVRVSKLYSTTGLLSTAQKIETAVAPGYRLYRIRQLEHPSGEQLRAWVWVSGNGGHEVWVYHRANQPDGFCFVGLPNPVTSVQHVSTRLLFEDVAPKDPDSPGDPLPLNINDYGASVSRLLNYLVNHEPDTPASSVADLQPEHHHRIVGA